MRIDNDELIITGKLIKILRFKEEWDIDVDNPDHLLKQIKTQGIKADIFTFTQRLPESKPKFDYYMEWDSIAAIPIRNYDYWLKKQVSQNSRKKIGLAKRKNVELKISDFNDEFVNMQLEIYHETPIRQGRRNWDYNIDFATAKKANATFLDRALFLGGYYNGELIGFIKIVDGGKFMRTMGILSKNSHRDKAPMNLLMAKAVEISALKNKAYLTYGKYDYGKLGSDTFKAFKRNLGFENILLPRYYIPLNFWGVIAIKFRLYEAPITFLPRSIINILKTLRSEWYAKKYKNHSIIDR